MQCIVATLTQQPWDGFPRVLTQRFLYLRAVYASYLSFSGPDLTQEKGKVKVSHCLVAVGAVEVSGLPDLGHSISRWSFFCLMLPCFDAGIHLLQS